MRVCVVCKGPVELAPPLLRLVHMLRLRRAEVDVFCVGGKGQIGALGPVTDDLATPNVHCLKGVSRRLRLLRPFLDTNCLRRSLTRGGDAWSLIVAYGPLSLAAVRYSNVGPNVPVIYYSDELYDHPRFILQQIAEKACARRIAGLISCQEDRERELRASLGLRCPGVVIPNSCFDHYASAVAEAGPRPPAQDSRLTFIYQGGLQPRKRCLYELVEVFGSGVHPARLRLQVASASAEEVSRFKRVVSSTPHPECIEFVDYRPYPSHFPETTKADVGVMLYRNVSRNYRYCAPNKLYEYPMLGLPVLASDQPHLKREVEGHGFGLCVDGTSAEQISQAVQQFCAAVDCRAMGSRAREWFLRHGQYPVHFERLEQFFGCVAANQPFVA